MLVNTIVTYSNNRKSMISFAGTVYPAAYLEWLCRLQYPYLFQNASTCVCMVTHISKSVDHPGKVANPPCGQLNREKESLSVPVRV